MDTWVYDRNKLIDIALTNPRRPVKSVRAPHIKPDDIRAIENALLDKMLRPSTIAVQPPMYELMLATPSIGTQVRDHAELPESFRERYEQEGEFGELWGMRIFCRPDAPECQMIIIGDPDNEPGERQLVPRWGILKLE